jgi:formate dehydrogenase major subunit
VLDPTAHIEEVKALTADIRAGRRPRGAELRDYVQTVRTRAGVTEKTGVPE